MIQRMRLLTSTIVASARIFGTRIGNYSHVRTGQKHMRAKPVGTKKKAKNKIKKQKKILKTNTRFNAISCAHTMWLFCRSGNERLVSTSHEFSMNYLGYEDPRILVAQGASTNASRAAPRSSSPKARRSRPRRRKRKNKQTKNSN
jgi:hypothetical protein